MRSGHFLYAQLDTAFLGDAKVRRLARTLPDPDDFYAAVGIYMVAVLGAWRTGSPTVNGEVEDASPRLIEALRAVGLFDDGGIPPRSFDKWTGSFMESQRRAKHAEVMRESRSRQSPEVTQRHGESPVTSSVRPSVPPFVLPSPGGGPGGDSEDPTVRALDAYWSLSGKYPSGRAKGWIERLAETYGGAAVASALASVPRESTHLIQDAESRLVRGIAEREAEERKQKEADRRKAVRDREAGRSKGLEPLSPEDYDRQRKEVQG